MEKKNKYFEMLKSFVSNIWYVIVLVVVCTSIVMMIMNWEKTTQVFSRLISVLMPFIIGFFLAYLINPLIKMIAKQLNRISKDRFLRVKKGISVGVAYVVILGIITIIIMYIFPQITESTKELGKSLTKGYDYIMNHKSEMQSKIPFINIDSIMDFVKNYLSGDLLNIGSKIFPYIYNLSSSLFSLVYNIFFGIVISIYIVLDSKNIVNSMRRIVYAVSPKNKAEGIWKTFLKCNHIFNGFLFGKAVDSLIIGILCFIAMTILQLPYALLLSIIVCITNMIPYFGPFIGAVPGVLIYLFINPKLSIVFAVMILILQQFDGWYLGPKILGDLTGIKPLWVIFGITVGGAYFGVMGMFLGVPATAVLMYLVDLFIEKKLRKKEIDLFDTK